MCHIATRCPQCPQCGRNFACGKIFPCAHAFGMGVCAITISADIAPSALGWGRDSLYPSPVIARKRAVFALRAEFLFLSFPKEKETKKKGNLRACALKNPLIVQSCYAQSKTSCLSSPQLQIALRCPSLPFGREKLYEAGGKSRGDHQSPAPAASIAAKIAFRWSECNFALPLLY